MVDFSINEMQRRLQDKYKDQWEPICPETGKNKMLWMIGEIGEVIDIIKKNGAIQASSDVNLRKECCAMTLLLMNLNKYIIKSFKKIWNVGNYIFIERNYR